MSEDARVVLREGALGSLKGAGAAVIIPSSRPLERGLFVFVCPGCKARFRITKAPKSGMIKCPKCGLVSAMKPPEPQPAGPQPHAQHPSSPPAPPPPPELAPGTIVAGHKILEYLGGSQFTAAYKASQTSMGRTVFFKVLRPQHTSDRAMKERFFATVRAAARLNHPALLSIFDMGEEGGVCFYTTEFVDGMSLPEFLRTRKVTSEQRLAIASQVAQALAYAHSMGVEQVWLSPEHVLVTEKCDVRVTHIGAGAPPGGGAPQTVMAALARIVHFVATGKDRAPGQPGVPKMPTARDALGNRFNAMVLRLFGGGEGPYKSVAEFAAEIEKLSQGVECRGAVNAATAPGGVVPNSHEKAHRREMPLKPILAGAAIAVAICAVIAYFLLQHFHSRKAEKLWKEAVALASDNTKLLDALRAFEQIAREYPDTETGKYAGTEIENVKRKIVAAIYNEAEAPFRDRPRETGAAKAAIKAARERLESMLGRFPLIAEQERIRLGNVDVRYTAAAIREWNKTTFPKVQSLYEGMRYGDARTEAQDFAKNWSESEEVQKTVDRIMIKINQRAQEKFDEIMGQVNQLVADKRTAAARNLLEKITNNFGIKEYVDQAQEKLKQL